MKNITFKSLRISKKLDISFLARQFEVSENEIRRIEKDSGDIPDEILNDYLKFFEVSYDSLYFGKEKENTTLESKVKIPSQSLRTILESKDKKLSWREFFYKLQNAALSNFISFSNLVNLELSILFILSDIYFFIYTIFIKSKKNKPKFMLAYFFIKLRACRNYRIIKWIYLISMFVPTILGFLLFHELPMNAYGYLYSWPANLCGALVVLSLWKKIWNNYFEKKQRQFLETLERYFTPFFRLFLPTLIVAVATVALNFPKTNQYCLTNNLIIIPLSLNSFLIALLIVLFFLPIIDLRYCIDSSINELFPLSSIVFSFLFLFFSSGTDVFYGKYENLGLFYINTLTIFTVTWFIYLFIAYRIKLTRNINAEKDQLRIKLISILYISFSILIYAMGGQRINIVSTQLFAFVPLLFIIFIFTFLFWDIKVQIKKARNNLL